MPARRSPNSDAAEIRKHVASLTVTSDAISRASYFVAKEIDAAAIITPTWSRLDRMPRVALSARQPITCYDAERERLCDFLSLCWGVVPLEIPNADTLDDMIRFSLDAARNAGYIESGQQVIITGGAPLRVAGRRTSSRSSASTKKISR